MRKWWTNTLSLLVMIFILLPILTIVLLAIGKAWIYPALLPQKIDLSYYFKMLFTNQELISSLLNSIYLAFGTIVLTLVIAYPTAIALANYQFVSKKLLSVLVYLPLVIPSIAIITNIDFMMIKFGLNGSFIGIVIVHTLFCLPYAIKLLVDNLSLYGSKFSEVSRNLGASRLQTFLQVTLPMSNQGLQGAILMTYIVSMTQYLSTLLIGDGKFLTLSVRMFPFTQVGRYKIAAVYAITFIVVTMIPLYLIDKFLIKNTQEVN
ncbi:ABC transporter permease [Companilactobacillus sp.]|uniref:ABC transporter permease n=1 Tax=Companilactobacillus sp. TaxID=2767905 RepID=UPI0025BCB06C|nr:ABC transporter permease subunit [Companilactobacillus sp.]MCH4008422.1 ABC transporter permease subunit [Companilactobacillus sp.]MCH4051399.1 ABC transporter permease subunit [Companilactobacillus sp.]MCH4076365.1 ABC transporter permease subunit [Companilactobacillus sp.]MCH4124940.1 ABC transporter permease subunit [Companilactobacillus sp.]MCH4131482.1 ABC transporter permease subunit [Companilactobacillus sp.]